MVKLVVQSPGHLASICDIYERLSSFGVPVASANTANQFPPQPRLLYHSLEGVDFKITAQYAWYTQNIR
jgi:hypothetical protein